MEVEVEVAEEADQLEEDAVEAVEGGRRKKRAKRI